MPSVGHREELMITEIVYFDLPQGSSREEVLEKYRSTAATWSNNIDLIEKHYFFDADNSRGGGVYIWKNMVAAEKWHGDEYKQRIVEIYGGEVSMVRHDTLLVVDNKAGELTELAPV